MNVRRLYNSKRMLLKLHRLPHERPFNWNRLSNNHDSTGPIYKY